MHGLRQAKTVQRARHVHVREQHLHIRAGFEEPQRLLSICALQDGEAGVLEDVGRNHAHEHFVLNEENHRGLSIDDAPDLIVPYSQPAVVRSLDAKCREGPGTAMTRLRSVRNRTMRAVEQRSEVATPCHQSRMGSDPQRPPSLGGVLERGGFLAARLVEDLRLVLIRIARGLDGPLGIGHQLADDRDEALTLSRMLVGVQDEGGLS